MLAAVIGVGTELTSGQIINKNAVWISKNLKDLGVQTSAHVVVPDERQWILDALRFCAERCDTLFVTGGLGPTTDDFTRELIAEWSGKKLEFHQASWDYIQERLSSRGIAIRESQRQQCMYPEGSQVLTNSEGTANGFQMRVFDKDIFVLPGPPREIEAIWKAGIAEFLKEKTKNLDRYITYSWDTIGLGESDISHITEECLKGVEVEKGYRVHMPYVEVKMSFLESQKPALLPWVEKVDEALRPMTVVRNGDDIATMFAQKLSCVSKIHVVDSLSGQILLNRLTPPLRSFMNEHMWTFSSEENYELDPQTVVMVLRPRDATSAVVEIHYRGASFRDIFEAPFMISKMMERKALYFTECALIFWLRMISRF
jgi:molybdenum cofactor synthesis domain-containing protein